MWGGKFEKPCALEFLFVTGLIVSKPAADRDSKGCVAKVLMKSPRSSALCNWSVFMKPCANIFVCCRSNAP